MLFLSRFKEQCKNLELYKNAETTVQKKFPHVLRIDFAIDSPA